MPQRKTTPYRRGYDAGHRLLGIAIDDYPSSDRPHYAKLQTAVNGAMALQHLLENEHGLHLQTTLLKNKDASRTAILGALDDLYHLDHRAAMDNDRECGTIIYLAGHGHIRYTRDGAAVGGFVPYDYAMDERSLKPGRKPEPEWNSLISFDIFTEARHFMASKHVLFIFDCCFAGGALTRSMLSLHQGSNAEYAGRHMQYPDPAKSREELRADLVGKLTNYRSYQALAAGRYEEGVLDGGGKPYHMGTKDLSQSAFTGTLLRGLQEAADDFGMITADMLAIYLRRQFASSVRADHIPSHGYLPGHDGGDYVFNEGSRKAESVLGRAEPLKQRKGVIVIVSPSSATNEALAGRDKTQWMAVEYHRCDKDDHDEVTFPLDPSRSRGPLTHLWLVHSQESEPMATAMKARYAALGKLNSVQTCLVSDAYDIEAARQVVAEILVQSPLPVGEMIVDVTGGTTPMSIGAAFACKEHGCEMQYCQPNHLAYAGGRPDTTRAVVPISLKYMEHTDESITPLN